MDRKQIFSLLITIFWPVKHLGHNLLMQGLYCGFLYLPFYNAIKVYILNQESIYGSAGLSVESWVTFIVILFLCRRYIVSFDDDGI